MEINPWIRPGTYTENGTNHIVVVYDVCTQLYHTEKQLMEHLETPLVIFRDLVTKKDEHKRYAMPLNAFTEKYTAI
jgi:hypothetical protein